MTKTSHLRIASETRARAGFPVIPASAFSMVLGTAGLANSWRAASAVWPIPDAPGRAIGLAAGIVWLVLIALYGLKWSLAGDKAIAEAKDPVQGSFVSLVGVATMLAATTIAPHSRIVAEGLVWAGAFGTLLFAVWRTGGLWLGGLDSPRITAALYLPSVAGGYVTAIAFSATGHGELAELAFGAGFFSWLAMESVLLNRFMTGDEPPNPLKPTIGIQLAPPAVGAVAYAGVAPDVPDLLFKALLGYGLLQFLIMLRVMPWVMRQHFAASYWSFSFGLSALATASIRWAARSTDANVEAFALALFVLVNTAMALLIGLTVRSLARGQFFVPQPRVG